MNRISKPSVLSPVQEIRSKPSKRHRSSSPRICSHSGCTTVLSVYNLTYYCSAHEGNHAKSSDFI